MFNMYLSINRIVHIIVELTTATVKAFCIELLKPKTSYIK